MIEYPNENVVNIWRQSISPTDENEIKDVYTAKNFHEIEREGSQPFNGLMRNTLSPSNTLLDGTLGHQDWWYSIGMLCTTPTEFLRDGIPGYPKKAVNHVRLWAGIPPELQNKCSVCYCNTASSNYYLYIIFILFELS